MRTDTGNAKVQGDVPLLKEEGDASGDPWWKPSLAGGVTVASLIAFFGFILYLLPKTGDPDLSWTRSMYLLSNCTPTPVGRQSRGLSWSSVNLRARWTARRWIG